MFRHLLLGSLLFLAACGNTPLYQGAIIQDTDISQAKAGHLASQARYATDLAPLAQGGYFNLDQHRASTQALENYQGFIYYSEHSSIDNLWRAWRYQLGRVKKWRFMRVVVNLIL
ncbi:MAG: hypothetical protein R2865_14230 [Deinococcales bacterium]